MPCACALEHGANQAEGRAASNCSPRSGRRCNSCNASRPALRGGIGGKGVSAWDNSPGCAPGPAGLALLLRQTKQGADNGGCRDLHVRPPVAIKKVRNRIDARATSHALLPDRPAAAATTGRALWLDGPYGPLRKPRHQGRGNGIRQRSISSNGEDTCMYDGVTEPDGTRPSNIRVHRLRIRAGRLR